MREFECRTSIDLASGSAPNFGHTVADECNDMHGAPPWCVDCHPLGAGEPCRLRHIPDLAVIQREDAAGRWAPAFRAVFDLCASRAPFFFFA